MIIVERGSEPILKCPSEVKIYLIPKTSKMELNNENKFIWIINNSIDVEDTLNPEKAL